MIAVSCHADYVTWRGSHGEKMGLGGTLDIVSVKLISLGLLRLPPQPLGFKNSVFTGERKQTLAPRFPSRLSTWLFICPARLTDVQTVRGRLLPSAVNRRVASEPARHVTSSLQLGGVHVRTVRSGSLCHVAGTLAPVLHSAL